MTNEESIWYHADLEYERRKDEARERRNDPFREAVNRSVDAMERPEVPVPTVVTRAQKWEVNNPVCKIDWFGERGVSTPNAG